MNVLADQVTAAGYANRILTERQLARLLGGTEARRYGLVNRALRAGALERVKRGLLDRGQPTNRSGEFREASQKGFRRSEICLQT